jgi:hypothetical protein
MLRLPGLPAKVVRRQNKRIPVDQLPNSTEKRLARTLLLPPPDMESKTALKRSFPKYCKKRWWKPLGRRVHR